MGVLLGKCSWLPGLDPLALRRSLPAGLPILLFCGGCSCTFYYTPPPISKSRGFVKFGICYKYSLFLVQFDWGPLRHCCAMPPLPKGEAIASQRVDDAKYNLSVACVLRLVLMPLPSVAKRHLFAKASPTRGGGIERSDDDGEVGQS